MSLAELTRHCFQNGIPAVQWIASCKLYISKDFVFQSTGSVEGAISNTVLSLYRTYPGDSDLRSYLRLALRNGLISVPHYVATIVQAARSLELHTPAILHSLCQIILDEHVTHIHPNRSTFSFSESPGIVLGTVQDGLAILRTAHSLTLSPAHPLMVSASELLIFLLSRVSDISQATSAQAMAHFADANDTLQALNLSEDLKQALQAFVVSLSLQIGDDAKVAREGQVTQIVPFSFGRADGMALGSNTDTVTCGLILHRLVSRRAKPFGSGSGSDPIVILVGTWRWSSWTSTDFYTQLFLSALTCLSQCEPSGTGTRSTLLWYAFIVGRLPRLVVQFENFVSEKVGGEDWRDAMQVALASVLRRPELIARCNLVVSKSIGLEVGAEDPNTPRPFSQDFLLQFVANGLIDRTFAITLEPIDQNGTGSRRSSEAPEGLTELESYLDVKLTSDTTPDEFGSFLSRAWKDPGSHADFAEIILKRFASLTDALDVEAFHHICKALYLNETALDLISLHVKISDLVFYALSFLENFECDIVGDPQTAVSHLGHVVLFLQSTLLRYHLDQDLFTLDGKSLSAAFLKSTEVVRSVQNLSGEDVIIFGTWFKALFDSSSDGIEDTYFRSTPPKVLLRLSATLLSHAITSYLDKKISIEVLTNGVAYFTGSPLNWTLAGIVKALLVEIERAGPSASVGLDILQTLLLSPECPRPVFFLCRPWIMRFRDVKQRRADNEKRDMAIRRIIDQTLKTCGNGSSVRTSQTDWVDQPQQAIRNALARARAGAAPSLDIDQCVLISPPASFLRLLWSELWIPASRGEMETCRRIMSFVLTAPRSANSPPLLPVFMHVLVPSLITTIDQQHHQEQTMKIEFLMVVITSALTACLHLEWALQSIFGESPAMDQRSAIILRRFAKQLRSKKNSPTSEALSQRLRALPSFMVNFPTVATELGM